MSVRFSADTSGPDALLDRLARPPADDHERLLALQFAAMQAATHVDTGSLRGSEDIGSSYAAGRWEGQVSAGGPAPGFANDPVVYAVYEAARGYPHDFRVAVERLARRHGRLMRDHLEGR